MDITKKLLIKDSGGAPSVTMTAFVVGFCVVNLKLLLAGVDFMGFKMSDFTGLDYSAAVSALGAIYVMRRNFGKTDSSGAKTE
jgi:hypothetical protein